MDARRSAVLVLFLALPPLAGACGPDAGQALQQRFSGWEARLGSCGDVAAYLEQHVGSFEMLPADSTIRLSVDPDGNLRATPGDVVVHRGSRVRWSADGLEWRIRFVGAVSPLTAAGAGSGPEAADLVTSARPSRRVDGSAPCGRYHYVVAARDTASDQLYLLDPPLIVRGD